jgi:cytochrome oxidase assembly protein ShyY1
MTKDTPCRLQKINEKLIKEKNEKETILNWISSQLSDGINYFITSNQDMTQQMITDHSVINDNINLYGNLSDKYQKMQNADNNNLNNILVNSQITVSQSKYFYVLWTIFAIALIIAFIIFIRKYSIT